MVDVIDPKPVSNTSSLAELFAEANRVRHLIIKGLQEEYFCEDVEPPEAAFGWSEEQIREFMESGGGQQDADNLTRDQPGGGRIQPPPEPPLPLPKRTGFALASLMPAAGPGKGGFDFSATCTLYREPALAHAIQPKPGGLFPPADPLLALLKSAGCEPFVPGGLVSSASGGFVYETHPFSWSHPRDGGCERQGVDLRLFFEPRFGDFPPRAFAAVRFSIAACGFPGSADDYVHGGAIITALDEVTAECVKVHIFPEATTSQLQTNLKAKVSPHVSYLVEASVTQELLNGMKAIAVGNVYETADAGAVISRATSLPKALATATSTMVNMAMIPAAMNTRYGE